MPTPPDKRRDIVRHADDVIRKLREDNARMRAFVAAERAGQLQRRRTEDVIHRHLGFYQDRVATLEQRIDAALGLLRQCEAHEPTDQNWGVWSVQLRDILDPHRD